MDDRITVRVRIEGRVQGVWFRGWTVEQARKFAISGWVRNRRDGTVEALFYGTEPAVRNMIALCHEGPPAAVVTGVEESPADPPDEADFRQLPTG